MISSQEDFYDMQDELLDRFGDIPAPAQALLDIALLRSRASKNGITEINQKGRTLMVYFANVDMERVSRVCACPDFRGRILFSAGDTPYLTLKLQPDESPLDAAVVMIDLYIGE